MAGEIGSELWSAPLWTKLFVIALYLVYLRYTSARFTLRGSAAFLTIGVVLAVREILYHFTGIPGVYFASDLVVAGAYLFWLRVYRGPDHIDTVFVVVNGLACAVIVLQYTVGIFPHDYDILLHLWVVFTFVFVGVHLYAVSPYNTENPAMLIRNRADILRIPVAFNVAALILGYGNPIVQVVLLPLSFSLHFLVIHRHRSMYDHEQRQRIEFLNNYMESLFEFMRTIGTAIAERIEISEVLDYVVKAAVKNTSADAGAILLVDEFEDVLSVKAAEGVFPPPYQVPDIVKVKLASLQQYFTSTPIRLGETILGEAAKTGQPVFVRNTLEDPRLAYNAKDDTCFISSCIVMPLVVSKRILGVLSIIRKQKNQYFDNTDFEHIKTFADYTSLTIDNLFTYLELIEKQEMEREVGVAADIQNRLLPRKLPKLPNASLGAFSIPARGVSGDYFDVIPIPRNGRVALVICDVAGKGVPASLVMVMIRTILHLIAGAAQDAATIVSWINRGIAGKINVERFATMSFLTFDSETKSIEYSNAAHHPLMIYRRRTKSIESLDTEGLPIGLERGTHYGQQHTILEPGDLVVLYTDGVIEAMDGAGRQYSYESLAKIVMEHSHLTPPELATVIREDVRRFAGAARQHDDQTLLLMKVDESG
jgi:phosphoserine phosphatase RsbU/P